MNDVKEIFKVLADKTRLRILYVLWSQEMCVCDIEDALELSQSNASRHLQTLRRVGIISSVKRAQWVSYSIDEDFCANHVALCAYLQVHLRRLDTFETDFTKLDTCKDENNCN